MRHRNVAQHGETETERKVCDRFSITSRRMDHDDLMSARHLNVNVDGFRAQAADHLEIIQQREDRFAHRLGFDEDRLDLFALVERHRFECLSDTRYLAQRPRPLSFEHCLRVSGQIRASKREHQK